MEGNSHLNYFGRLCHEGRVRMTMTRPELAKRVDTTPKRISDIETGKEIPPAHYVALVSQILGLDLEEVEVALKADGSDFQITRETQPRFGSQ